MKQAGKRYKGVSDEESDFRSGKIRPCLRHRMYYWEYKYKTIFYLHWNLYTYQGILIHAGSVSVHLNVVESQLCIVKPPHGSRRAEILVLQSAGQWLNQIHSKN